jgi:CMP-N-acetylneuraminic acid synthetase
VYETLLKVKSISEIIVNTDCDEVKDYLYSKEKIRIIERPEHLFGNHIVANDLITYDVEFCNTEHILQTHCTNPLLSSSTIENAIEKYFSDLDKHDSLFSVSSIYGRFYDHRLSPLNHKWELGRTQDMKPVYLENSAFFIFSKSSFSAAEKNRIGLKPAVFEMKAVESVDIDYEEDFILAELIYLNRHRFGL